MEREHQRKSSAAAPAISSGNFTFTKTLIDGVIVVDSKRFCDPRGYFMEAYKKPDFVAGGIPDDFVQENQSQSVKGAVRGLHFQKRHPQSKLVRVIKGAAFDVAVDVRPGSPTFGKWHGELLSGENGRQLYLPHGCAHGIMILSDEAVFAYKADDVYHPEDEAGVLWSDPEIGIDWPLPIECVVLSDKDRTQPLLSQYFSQSNQQAN